MNRFIAVFTIALLPLFAAQYTAAQDPIEEIRGFEYQPSLFDAVDENRVLVLRSEEDAKTHLSESNFERLLESVDFETQTVVVLAWRGSGGDRVKYKIIKSWPEQISMRFEEGMTNDLRTHQKFFALSSNVSCYVEGNEVTLNTDGYFLVEMKGKLDRQDDGTYTLAAKSARVTLDFKGNEELIKTAESLIGKSANVAGYLAPTLSSMKVIGTRIGAAEK